MSKPLVYLAGPLFSDQDRDMLLSIEKAFIGAGIRCFLPHREVGDLSVLKNDLGEEAARRYVFDSDVGGVEDCIVLCALLDGSDVDSGTAAEMGFAHAIGKPVFGLCTDGLRRGRTINNVIWGVCAGGHRIYPSVNEMVTAVVDALLRTANTTFTGCARPSKAGIAKNALDFHLARRGSIQASGSE
jgi:nucleoside 2-deoxyribosyltransferase